MASRLLSLALLALCLSAERVSGVSKSTGAHHHDASAADGLCPHFSSQNATEFRRVCINGGAEEPHTGTRRAVGPPRGSHRLPQATTWPSTRTCRTRGARTCAPAAATNCSRATPSSTAAPDVRPPRRAQHALCVSQPLSRSPHLLGHVRGWWPFTKPGHLQLLCGHCGSLLGSALRYGGVPPSWRRFTAASACLGYKHELEHGHARLREAFDPLASGEGRWYAAKMGPKGQRQSIAQRAQAGAQSVLGGSTGLFAARYNDTENRGNVSERHRRRTHPLAQHMTEDEFDKVMAGPLGWLLYFLSTAGTVLGIGLFVIVFCVAPMHKERKRLAQRARAAKQKEGGKKAKPALRVGVEGPKDH